MLITMNMWYWLNSNSSSVQSVAALASTALTLITIFVLFKTWRAIQRQATATEEQVEAARVLTQVAKDQTKAAVDAAESARRQSDLLSSQIEQSIAPLLVAEPDDRNNMKNHKLVNRGPGVAFQIICWQGGFEPENQSNGIPIVPVQPSTLGAGNSTYLPIPPAWEVFTVRYKGIDRIERWTVVYRDPYKSQQHLVRRGLQVVYLS